MARMTMKGAYDNGANGAFPGPANDRSPGPRNSERQITAAAVTQGAVDFVYGASLRVFLIPNEGAITKVSGDFKDNLALNTKWMLSPFALGALTVQPSKRFATERTITKPHVVSSGDVSPVTVATCCEMLLDMLQNLITRELACLREHILFIIASGWPTDDSEMTVKQLRDALTTLGVEPKGLKADLRKQLESAHRDRQLSGQPSNATVPADCLDVEATQPTSAANTDNIDNNNDNSTGTTEMTVAQLRNALDTLGVKPKGLKADLRQQLECEHLDPQSAIRDTLKDMINQIDPPILANKQGSKQSLTREELAKQSAEVRRWATGGVAVPGSLDLCDNGGDSGVAAPGQSVDLGDNGDSGVAAPEVTGQSADQGNMLSDSASVGDKRTTKQQKQQARATKIANRKVHNASTWPANFPVFDSFKQDFNYQQYITVEQRFKEHVLNKQMTSAERKTAMREFWRNDAQSHQPDESDESDTSESESEGVFLYCQGDANVAVKCSTHLKCAAGEACKCPEIPIFSTGGGRHACYGQCGDQLHGQCGDQHDSNEMHRICMQCKEKLSVAAPTPSADLATAKNLVNNGGANGGDSGDAAPEVASTVQSPSGNGIDQGEPTESPIGSVAAPTLSADLATAKNLVNNGGANGGDSGGPIQGSI